MLSKLLVIVMLVGSIVLLASCARTNIYPITDKDIFFREVDGQSVICMSDDYVKDVLKARVK